MATVNSTRFGTFEVAEGAVLDFPQGMVGFPSSRRYALVAREAEDLFFWLHSLDEPAVAFPVADPWAFHPSYELEIGDPDLELLGASEPDQLALLAVVAVGSDPADAAINLLAPVAVNLERRVGAQVLNRLEAPARAPLFAAGAEPRPAAVAAVTVLPA